MEKTEKLTLRECIFGDKNFYRHVLAVVLPIIVQNTLTNVVSLLDNVMVGQVGTLPMSGVAIVGQLIFVYNLAIWGSTSGAGLFGAQYFGSGDMEGVRHTFRFKLLVASIITVGGMLLFGFAGKSLIGAYIAADTAPADAAATLGYAWQYLCIMLVGLVPFALTQCYAGTLRESGQTVLPMKASMIAMVVNFAFNALLIFGLLGFPRMGVAGAAVATVLSRFVELAVVVVGAHRSLERYPFFAGVYASMHIPAELAKNILLRSMPLLLNELMWGMGQAILLQCYSVRGIQVVAALNICNTISQIFNEVFLSLGNATAIVVGQELGADRMQGARRSAWRMLSLSVMSCVVMGSLLSLCAPLIPQIYNTEESIRLLSTELIRAVALCMPLFGFANCAYFTLRSGGKTFITFLFDSCFTCGVTVPVAYVLAHFTAMPIVTVFLLANALDLIKCVIGFVLLKKGIWVKNIVKATPHYSRLTA